MGNTIQGTAATVTATSALSLAACLTVVLALGSPAPARADQVPLADLVEQTAPAVVNVHTAGIRQEQMGWSFFGNAFGVREWTSLGSGFVVDAAGLIITNLHVVQDATTIRVGLMDGRIFDASLVGSDPATDLALLSVEATDLPVLEMSLATPRVGDDVFAVGNPFGYDHTVTAGIISAKYRNLGLGPYDDFLQTDASINPGNSGGPLLDMNGRVTGVNTVIHAGGEGLGFAVPVEMLQAVLPRLKRGGTVTRGWTGVRVDDDEDGVFVADVYEEGPGLAAGVKIGDRIEQVGDRLVHSSEGWSRALGSSFPGDSVTLKLLRGGKAHERTLKVVDYNEWAVAQTGSLLEVPALGIAVRVLPPDRAADLDLKTGLEVVEISSRAELQFFRPGDIILQMGQEPLTDPMQVPPLADKVVERREISAIIIRDGRRSRLYYRW